MTQCNYRPTGETGPRGYQYHCEGCLSVVWLPVADATLRGNCNPAIVKPPPEGPGQELKSLLASLHIKPDKCGGTCAEMTRKMNEWGAECASHRQEIIDHLKVAYSRTNWTAVLAAGVRLLAETWFNPLDPFGSIVDEAIRLAGDSRDSPGLE